ncbi:hypothetical protein BD310DRAFT_812385 [Dichomitus squalens]|uniref:Rho termination factor N-terminal domain-containing protein n=1 Tax=Dichomitus squalens TaxID=114155 RepID=A0A4Q9Q4Q4_9APHY|nr:hypothetical protein BD310DRAFT_812385 [Dichomitus squalens]
MPSNVSISGPSSAYTPPELSKLTVPQLKALCKERKISGYSKLGKQPLLQKLTASGYYSGNAGELSTSGSKHTVATTLVPTASDRPSSSRGSQRPESALQTVPDTLYQRSAFSDSIAPETIPNHNIPITRPPSVAANTSLLAITTPSSQTKRAENAGTRQRHQIQTTDGDSLPLDSPTGSPCLEHVLGSPSRANQTSEAAISGNGSVATVQGCPVPAASSTRQRTHTSIDHSMPPPPPKRARVLPLASSLLSKTTSAPSSVLAPSKRFKPLVITRRLPSNTTTPTCAQAVPQAENYVLGHDALNKPLEASLLELESNAITMPQLSAIAMPPTLSQRKRVQRWAVILSGLSDQERAVCVLVSRAFRYAVYLSAACLLARDYTGRRLREDVLKKYPPAMTNMWPYLRVRETEVARRRSIFESSFLWRLIRKLGLSDPIAAHIWASPDHPKQLSIAVRFVLTRAWFELSIGLPHDSRTNPNSWLHGTIVDVREVVPAEVWSVTIHYSTCLTPPREREVLYILEATCEVIGRPSNGCILSLGESAAAGLPLRADWSTYIAHRVAPCSIAKPLVSHMKWACQEDYDQGISTLWLKRVSVEGQLGITKRTIADRYVMACVVGNSISGHWMTTNEMAQEFAGLPARVAPQYGKQKNTTLNLFLPEHHHVESVHLAGPGGKNLHPALAVIQTPHREYFVLRDNGMQVGCEEDGVADIWQELLRCDCRGNPV